MTQEEFNKLSKANQKSLLIGLAIMGRTLNDVEPLGKPLSKQSDHFELIVDELPKPKNDFPS